VRDLAIGQDGFSAPSGSPMDGLKLFLSLIFNQHHESHYIEGVNRRPESILASSTEGGKPHHFAVLGSCAASRITSNTDTEAIPATPHETRKSSDRHRPGIEGNARTLLLDGSTGGNSGWGTQCEELRPMQCACRRCLRDATG